MSSLTDSGKPIQRRGRTGAQITCIDFGNLVRQVSLQNVGSNTLWVSLLDPATASSPVWFYVACGTSWDDRTILQRMWLRTQTGRTRFVLTGVRLCDAGGAA